MKRFAILAASGCLAAALAGAAFAQGASSPDPLTLPSKSNDNTVTVPGTLERPAPSPDGDPRTPQQRRRDARAFDRCVAKVQDRLEEAHSANPVMDDPEGYCSQRLGMKDRDSLPASRLPRSR